MEQHNYKQIYQYITIHYNKKVSQFLTYRILDGNELFSGVGPVVTLDPVVDPAGGVTQQWPGQRIVTLHDKRRVLQHQAGHRQTQLLQLLKTQLETTGTGGRYDQW